MMVKTGKRFHSVKRRRRLTHIATHVVLIILSAFFLLPFLWMVRSSLMPMYQIFIIPPMLLPDPIQWSNYQEALTSIPFGQYYINTFIITFSSMLGVLVSSSVSAYSFSRIQWPGRDKIFGIMLTAMMLPFAVTLIPTFIGWKNLGAVDTYWPLILPSWLGGGMYNVFLLRQFFRSIPKEYEEAAFIDGAGHVRIFLRIILPLTKPALITVALFSFLNTWNDFMGPLVYLNTEDKYTVALGLQQFVGIYSAQWHLLMAASTVAVLPVVVLFFIGQRYLIEGISLTGVKG